MSAVGGSIESVTLDGRPFPVGADIEAQVKLGGFENEVQANGNGTVREIKTRVPSSIDGLATEVDSDRGDHEFLQELANRNDLFPVAISYANGATYQGRMAITGEIQASTQNASVTFSLMGTELTKQN